MEIKALKTFLLVADLGTVAEAAKRLNCVQSNVTARIKALEDELDLPLFIRSRAGMALTSAGLVLRDHARAVLRAERDAGLAMAGLAEGAGLLRIGSMESTLATRLPERLAGHRAAHPGIRYDIATGPTDDLVQQVLDGTLDIALIGGDFSHPSLRSAPVFREEMVLVTDGETASPDAARNAPSIVFRSGCSYRAFALNWLRENGFGPNDVMEMGTLDGILGCVAAGIGVSILPRSVAETGIHARGINSFGLGEDSFIDTFAIWRSSGASPQIDRFVQFLKTPESVLYISDPV